MGTFDSFIDAEFGSPCGISSPPAAMYSMRTARLPYWTYAFWAEMGIGTGIDIGDNPACISIILFNLNLVLANLISVLYNMDASERYRSGQNSLDSEYMSAWQFCLPGILDI